MAQKKIEEHDNSGFGKYKESTGGGKPFSTSNTRTTRENGKYRQANNDTQQARDASGRFTYKSVNGESIDPKYGPSRGKTINPLLLGDMGKDLVYIEDVEKEFESKSGSYWDKYKDKWYVKGSKSVLGSGDYRTKIAGESIWEIARHRYDEVKKQFGGEIKWDDDAKEWVATEEMSEEKVFSETKKGRPTASEQAAKVEAKSTGEQAHVIDPKTGGIELAPNAGSIIKQAATHKPIFANRIGAGHINQHQWVPKMATPTMTTAQYQASLAPSSPSMQAASAPAGAFSPSMQAASAPAPQASASAAAPAPKPQTTHSAQDLANLRTALLNNPSVDKNLVNNLTDSQLDKLFDKLTKK